ncbi:hypothetical protein AKJ37_05760 [candidate division MSBL1 archaeon SCGC-AAA259I09]|uniref:Uncharacterized protein n=1 Tax=candidate division MSBL1 archaeon SCGC-AAA259I09 TaxID=1698267 RepID=A0A133UPZ0_9EURY|nr:hypothetical protein AKJ37_05760 [candidate division MSBL1 archaeon SCGC-AAA259I09]
MWAKPPKPSIFTWLPGHLICLKENCRRKAYGPVDVFEVGDKEALVLKNKVAREEAPDRGRQPGEKRRKRL